MTIQVKTPAAGKSKAALQTALNTNARDVWFEDPSVHKGSRGLFVGSDIKPHEQFPVVMDPQTRMRFSTLQRKADGTFRIS